MRHIISFLLVLMAIAANARQVSPDEAQSIAAEFFDSSPKQVSPKGVKRVAPKDMTADSQPYYIFNAADNAGFVIISGDDRARKILGYSDKGDFDFNNLPPQLEWLLQEYGKQIEAIPATAPQDPSWQSADAPATEGGVVLETANWGQGAPYNAQCPIIDGVQAPTGCVATAMAIVMKYHNWPEQYNWDAMPAENETPSESAEIAKLMHDIGISVEMQYGAAESEAYAEQARYALVEDFEYSNSLNQLFLKYIDFEMLSQQSCVQEIKEQINKSQPCLFSGSSKEKKGHMFVCDGYNGDLIHINWGWYGSFNGFYTLSTVEDGAMVYTDYQLLFSEIKKKEDNLSRVFIDSSVNCSYTGYGLNMMNKNIVPNERLKFVVNSLGAPLDYNGDVTLALVDENGNIKELLKGQDKTYYRIDDAERNRLHFTEKFHRFYWDSRWRECYFEQTPAMTDSVCVVAKEDGYDQWLIVPGSATAANKVPAVGNIPKTIRVNIINPDGARLHMDVSFDGESEEIAKVDFYGNVVLGSVGNTRIIAEAADGSGVQAQCPVKVVDKSGINDVPIDADAEVEIYSMTGILLFEGKYSDAKLSEGIYIVVMRGKRFKQRI